MTRHEADSRQAGRPRAVAELARISWRRARRFPPYSPTASMQRRSTPPWLIPLIWPAFVASAAREAKWIRTLPGASATVEPGPPVASDPRARRAGAGFLAVVLGVVLAVVLGFTVIPDLLSPIPALALTVLLMLVVMTVWGALLFQALAERKRTQQEPEADIKDLKRRRDELAADGPAYAVTYVLADQGGTGAATALLEALKTEWRAEGAVAVLYPATEELVGYYARRGAVPDRGAQRRMIFDYRRTGQ